MKGFKDFIIYSNVEKDYDLILSEGLRDYIISKGCNALIISEDWNYVNEYIDEEALNSAECVIVMGGDGTMLRAAHAIGNHNISMIGVNLGTLGFLTEVEEKNILKMADRLISGEFSLEKRMMLTGCVTINGEEKICQDALNDIVLSRSGTLRIVAFNIYVNGQLLDTYEADGVIVSTPTGSTGYNLSAGGPIVSPNAELILVTPISPHALSAKSVVFDAKDVIKIEILKKRRDSRYRVHSII